MPRLTGVCVLLLLAGCVSQPSRDLPNQLNVNAVHAFCCWQSTHGLSIETGGGEQELLAVLASTQDRIELVLLSPAGQTLANARWQRGALQFEASVPVAQALDPEALFMVLLFAWWPDAIWQFSSSDWSIRREDGSRTLLNGGAPLIDVEYSHSVPAQFPDQSNPLAFISGAQLSDVNSGLALRVQLLDWSQL